MGATPQLRQGLSQRQLTMIAIGGIIGAGFFVGSGVVIGKAGPAATLTYALCGVLIILVMRMLGEMATANPSTGSFAEYAREALGGWAGFSVGWLYWYYWVIVVGFEAVAGAKVITYWFPAPLWLLSLILMALMTATNLFSVASYGEFEFWFAGIKVAAIILFLLLGSMYAFGLWPHRHADLSNLHAHGGFFPNGLPGAFGAIVVVIFSMVGAEVATIAAAETSDPERAIARATNAVAARIAIFFVGSVFLLTVVMPWNSVQSGSSPFVAALKQMGIPGADHLMNAVVLTAVLSCLNSGLYSASRVLFVLAGQHEAPARLLIVSRRGVPYLAIVGLVGGGLPVRDHGRSRAEHRVPVSAQLVGRDRATGLFADCVVADRVTTKTPPEKLRVKMWFFPALSILTVAGIAGVLVQMAFDSTARVQFWLSLLSWAVTVALYFVTKRVAARAD